MGSSSLHNKTIRPGSLNGYSYYYSNRQPHSRSSASPRAKKKLPFGFKKILLIAVLLAVPIISFKFHAAQTPTASKSEAAAPAQGSSSASSNSPAPQSAAAAPVSPVNVCGSNTLEQVIKVSISQRHSWVCEGNKLVYDFPVITGMEAHPETLTPPGTYKIYGKQRDTRLTGSDVAGSWNYPVSYWMPFLSNQHGIYGFHDATWRPDSEFGSIDPNSSDASHGCVELPLAASGWLYSWARVGTTVSIES